MAYCVYVHNALIVGRPAYKLVTTSHLCAHTLTLTLTHLYITHRLEYCSSSRLHLDFSPYSSTWSLVGRRTSWWTATLGWDVSKENKQTNKATPTVLYNLHVLCLTFKPYRSASTESPIFTSTVVLQHNIQHPSCLCAHTYMYIHSYKYIHDYIHIRII
jgi:hypothetical protein